MVESKMNPLPLVRKHLEQSDGDLPRELLKVFVERLMSAEADILCGAPLGQRSEDRRYDQELWIPDMKKAAYPS